MIELENNLLTVLLRALGIGTDAEIIELLGEDERLAATLEKDNTKTVEEGLIEIYKKLDRVNLQQ